MARPITFDTTGLTPEQIKQKQAERRKQNSKAYHAAVREKKGLPKAKPRIDRSQMNPEERRLYKNELQRGYYKDRQHTKTSEERLAQMRATRIRLYKAECEAAGREYIPKAERSKAKKKRLAIPKTPRVPKPTTLPLLPKHKMDPIKIGKPLERVLPTRNVDESKLIKLYIPERRMHVLYDPLVKSEQEVREKYVKA